MRSVFRDASKHLHRERSALFSFRPTYLHQEVAERIADRLYDIKRDFPRLLEYKSAAGYMHTLLDKEKCGRITCCDTSPALLSLVDVGAQEQSVDTVLATHNNTLPFEHDTFDAITSNLSLHWHNDVVGMLTQMNNCML